MLFLEIVIDIQIFKRIQAYFIVQYFSFISLKNNCNQIHINSKIRLINLIIQKFTSFSKYLSDRKDVTNFSPTILCQKTFMLSPLIATRPAEINCNEMEEIKEKHTSPTNPVLFSEKVTTVEEKQEVEEFRNKVINEVGNNDNPNFYSNEKISV